LRVLRRGFIQRAGDFGKLPMVASQESEVTENPVSRKVHSKLLRVGWKARF
jgi:hypothetical protein